MLFHWQLEVCHRLCVASRDVGRIVATTSTLCLANAQHVLPQSSNAVKLAGLVPGTVAVIVQGGERGAHASLVLPLDSIILSAYLQ
jgi:hypothetical protein